MTRALTIALIVLAAFLAVRGMRGPDTRVAEAKEARADSLFSRMLEREHALADELETRGAEYMRLATERDSVRRISDRAASYRPQVVERIVKAAGDSAQVVTLVTELEEVHGQEVGALRAELVVADSMLAGKDSVIATYARLNTDLRVALVASRSASHEWERAAKPELLGIRMTPARGFAAGVLATLVAVVVLR